VSMSAKVLEPTFVACGVIAVALAVAALLWGGLGQPPALACLAGILAALISAISVGWIKPARRAAVRPDIHGAANADLAERFTLLSKRFDAMEARLNGLDQSMIERTRATIRAVSAELDAVGSVVRELAEAVAIHDSELFAEPRPPVEARMEVGAQSNAKVGRKVEAKGEARFETASESGTAAQASSGSDSETGPPIAPSFAHAPVADRSAPAEPRPVASPPAQPVQAVQAGQAPAAAMTAQPQADETGAQQAAAHHRAGSSELRALLPMAVAQDRLELHLQSIVSLPQRKVKLYEAMHYLRGDQGRVFSPASLRQEAESAFAEAPFDNLLISRAQRVIRHLKERNREIALLCRVSSRSFFMPEVFSEVTRLAKTNRDEAQHIVFCLDQAAVRAMGPLELENIDALQRMGFRLGLDGVTDLRVDPRQLVERGFRYMKVPADLLLGDDQGVSRSEIHPADLAGLLARHGLTLIAEGIGSEKTVLDVLDFGVQLAQGSLFSPPRAVRIDLLDADSLARPRTPSPPEARQEEVRNSFRSILRRANA
jgi:cyclic-di-GMP phosphodiesterase, flagellum assembly factor TipF